MARKPDDDFIFPSVVSVRDLEAARDPGRRHLCAWMNYGDVTLYPLDRAGIEARCRRFGMLGDPTDPTPVALVHKTVKILEQFASWWVPDEHEVYSFKLDPTNLKFILAADFELDFSPGAERRAAAERRTNRRAEAFFRDLSRYEDEGILFDYLITEVARSANERHKFKRCQFCRQWFVISMPTTLTCSDACRNAKSRRLRSAA